MMDLMNPGMFDDFSIWLNNQRDSLNSNQFNVTDIDKVIHRYCTWTNGIRVREVQAIMFLEIKTNGAKLRPNQKDTLFQVHQLVTTGLFPWQFQRDDGTLKKGHVSNNRKVHSIIAGKVVELKCYGVFCLRMSGTDPENSDWIEWSSCARGLEPRAITKETMLEIFRFERNPVSLRKENPARPHKRGGDRCLPLFR